MNTNTNQDAQAPGMASPSSPPLDDHRSMLPPPPRPPKTSQPISQNALASRPGLMGPPPPQPKPHKSSQTPRNEPTQLRNDAELASQQENSELGSSQDAPLDSRLSDASAMAQGIELDSKESLQGDGIQGPAHERPQALCKEEVDQKDGATVENGTEKKLPTASGGSAAMVSLNQLYSVPPWSAAPGLPFSLEVIKEGLVIDTLDVSFKSAYMFGRSDRCDFMLEHPTLSRYHAVLQYKRNGDAFIYDLGSTHGTFVNKKQVQGKIYVPLHVGDVLKFGLSSRLYVLQGPTELMPKEGPTKAERQVLRELQFTNDQVDREASLLRARKEAMDMEGATWGMMEDAIEEDIEQEEEVTWRNYKGQLTEKQEKTLEKIQKRNEKLSSLKREIDAIQVKEIPQGGLTQGQQTQIARNEQRIEQLMEEVENLEETLNQSIQESIGARGRKGLSGRRGDDNEDEDLSDDDDFYDRTNKGSNKRNQNAVIAQVVETAESLLGKRETLMKNIENLSELLESEVKNQVTVNETFSEQTNVASQDPLDAFMTDVSSSLVKDRAFKIRKDLDKQQSELDRIVRLLKIADPTGEALRKWSSELRPQIVANIPNATETLRHSDGKASEKRLNSTTCHAQSGKQERASATHVIEEHENKNCSVLPLEKPQDSDDQVGKGEQEVLKGALWLGAGHVQKVSVESSNAAECEEHTNGKVFLEYRERKKANVKTHQNERLQGIPEDAAGLVLRTPRKPSVENAGRQEEEDEKKIWAGAAAAAADTVALLLRHQRGLGAIEEEMQDERPGFTSEKLLKTTKKRKLGPEKPAFLERGEEADFQSWVPPEGQSGDGRTSLNDKYGY